MTEPNRDAILKVLLDHGVDFVVVGATAAILQGVPIAATADLDVAAAKSQANMKRLEAALHELEARLRLRDVDERVEAPLDARMLANLAVVTLMTRFGPLDVLFAPDGAPAYAELKKRAIEVAPFHLAVRAASPEDLIAMKKAAGREKDAAHLAALQEYLRSLPHDRE